MGGGLKDEEVEEVGRFRCAIGSYVVSQCLVTRLPF